MVLEEEVTVLATYTIDNAINDILFKVFTKYLLAAVAVFGAIFVKQLKYFLGIIAMILGVLGTIDLLEILSKLIA